MRRGGFNERYGFGQVFTGVFSNGDLVANYEGFLFYRSLFEDDVIPGKRGLQRFLDRELPRFCAEYEKNPEIFVPSDEKTLRRRYAHLGLRENPRNRMDYVCAERWSVSASMLKFDGR